MPGNIFVVSSIVVINVNAFQLKVRVTDVLTSGVDSMLVGDDFPELEKMCSGSLPSKF